MDASNSPILYSNRDGIAHIRFNRPASLNAIDEEMAKALCNISYELQKSADVRVVVMSGEGAAFMAGGDLARFHQDKARTVGTADAIIKPLNVALMRLAALPQPIIASVHGAVAGAGVSIALACDLCIAADDTQFNLAYARIGASPDAGSTWSLPRVVGTRKALELVLLAESFSAEEALRLGIVNRVISPKSLADATQALAQRLAAGPGFAYGRMKRLIYASFDTRLEDQLDAERKAFCACAATEDFAEGLDAFFEKRRPVFTGICQSDVLPGAGARGAAMKMFKKRTWKSLLVLASGLAVLAMSYSFDDPAPTLQVQSAMPPPVSWNDIFKGPP